MYTGEYIQHSTTVFSAVSILVPTSLGKQTQNIKQSQNVTANMSISVFILLVRVHTLHIGDNGVRLVEALNGGLHLLFYGYSLLFFLLPTEEKQQQKIIAIPQNSICSESVTIGEFLSRA